MDLNLFFAQCLYIIGTDELKLCNEVKEPMLWIHASVNLTAHKPYRMYLQFL